MAHSNDWLSSYKNWIISGNITDACEMFLESSALMILSTVVNRNVFLTYGNDRIFPSLWILLIGRSGETRKSTCIRLANRFVVYIKPNMVMEQAASDEYFRETLAEKGRAIIIQDEFISFLDSLKKEYSSLTKKLLTELFDRDMSWSSGTKGQGRIVINDPFINIVSATSPAWLQEAISESDIKGGFLPRFMMVFAEKKEREIDGIPGYGDEKRKKGLIEGLDMISKITYQAQLSNEAGVVYKEFQQYLKKETKEKGDVIGSFNARLDIYSLKLALLYHVSDLDRIADETISVDDMQKGVDFASRVCASQEKILSNLAFSQYQVKRQKVLDIIEFCGEEGIMHSKLMRKIQVDKSEFRKIIDSLLEEESIFYTDEESSGKKPGRWYKLKNL